jgi:hypothetical protein
MIREIIAHSLKIVFNAENVIQSFVFNGVGGEQLVVMFEKWGLYNPEAPQPIRVEVNCGGFVSGVNEDGEMTFDHCFLSRQQGHLVALDEETEVQAFVLHNRYLSVLTSDAEGTINIQYNTKQKRKGREMVGEVELPFHVWDFEHPIHLLVQSAA